MLDFQGSRYLMKGEVAGQAGNDHPTGIPTGVFPTSDGMINIAASSGRLWTGVCKALGKPEFLDKPEWKTQVGRSADRKAINAAISEVTKTKTSEYWIGHLEEAGIPCGPINTIDKTFNDPQVKHLGIAQSVESPKLGKITLVGSPINLEGLPKGIRSATAEPGEHTDEVLATVGYTPAELASMRAAGII